VKLSIELPLSKPSLEFYLLQKLYFFQLLVFLCLVLQV